MSKSSFSKISGTPWHIEYVPFYFRKKKKQNKQNTKNQLKIVSKSKPREPIPITIIRDGKILHSYIGEVAPRGTSPRTCAFYQENSRKKCVFFTKCKIPSCHYYKPKKVEGLISPVGLTCKDKNINNHEPKIRETSLISTSVESTAASMHKQTPPARNSDVSIKNSDSAVTQSIETNNPLQSENDLRTLNIYFTNEEFEILKRYKDNSKTSLIKRRVDPKIILLREREQFPLRMFVLNNTYFAELNAWDAKVWANLIFKDGQLQTEKYFLSLKQMLMTSFPHTKKQEVCK